tara:strand:+ start:25839 stop:27503 length:1665 start_codon:yes stop_codon:yes gene_type:complete
MVEVSGAKEFVFTHSELERLERSVRKITAKALQVLGAEGPILMGLEKLMEPIALPAAELQQVAEGDVIDMRDRFKGKRGIAKSQFSPEEEEERIALRKRYYGPEGEVTKIRPGSSRKGLDKPFTQMSPAEFEEAGYVLRVPETVLDDFALMVEETKRAGNLFEEARDWYHNIRRLLDQETPNDRDATLLGLLIATYSPRAKFALNLVEAAYMFKAVQQDAVGNPELLKEYLETFPGAEKRDPGARRGFTKAHKVPNFALNLIAPELSGVRGETGEVSYDDMNMWNSTIDTWMIDAFYPLLKKASTQKEYDALKGKMMSDVTSYRYMTGLVAQEAKKLNLLPHELQAIVWVAMKRRQSGADAATTEESIGQIKEAIQNIRLINNDLGAVRQEMEDNSWLGLLFKEIDEKGFEEAAKFTLGIKDEKGKTAVSGVRSLTSKGKKGDQFKYFPPEPPASKASKVKGDAKPARPKPEKRFEDPKYSELATFYVMNKVIQMPTGKFNNLYDSVSLYLDPEFSVDRAIEYITGRWDPEAKATSKYFKEEITRKVMQRFGIL